MAHQTPPPPDPSLSAAVATLIERRGMVPAARALGLGRETAARIAAGLPVRAGSAALAAQRIALAASGSSPSSPPPRSGAAAA